MSYLLAFVGFAFLIIMHELGHFSAAKWVGMKVEKFSLFFPPTVAKIRRGETDYCLGITPLGGYVKITGMNPQEDIPEEDRPRAYYNMPVWKRIVVIGAGPAVNLVIALLVFTGLNYFAAKKIEPVVGEIQKGTPAAQYLQPGDRIVSVDGKRGGVEQFRSAVIKHKCEDKPKDGCKAMTPVKLVVKRDGLQRTIEVYPEYNTSQPPAAMRLGFSYELVPANYSLTKSVGNAFEGSWQVSKATIEAISRIFDPEKRKEISGVVGSYKVTQESFSLDFVLALQILGIISLSLALINLFPFLPLDGGHIFFSLMEKVRGKPISFETMQRASVFGFLLVIMLFVIGLTNDINRLTGEGFKLER